VAHLQEVFEVSQRRACEALGVNRTSVRYVGRRPDNTAARVRIRELAGSGAGSAIAACTGCCAVKDGR
jgi:putative transposase